LALFKNGTKTKTAGTAVLSRNHVVLPPSIIGPRTRIQGTIGGSGPLTIRGTVEGKIAIRDRLNVAPGASVQAEVEAEKVELQGRIDGVIRAHEWVRIVEPGWLEGDAISPQAQVGLGAIIRGGLLIRSTGRRRGV
jgi:cytoskeletal protein CcmA (bactofilin family)